MATLTNPAEIARETLKQMMARRLPPSPENYRAIYNEIAGIAEAPGEAIAEREARALLRLLPKETPAQQGLARQIDEALRGRKWDVYRQALAAFIREHSAESDLAWGELISDFLREWETKQAGLTQAKKRESLDRVLAASANSELLFGRLQNLIRAWSANEAGGADIELAPGVAGAPGAAEAPKTPGAPASAEGASKDMPLSRANELLYELRETLALTLDDTLAALLADEPKAAAQAKALAAAVREAASLKAVHELVADIKRFAFQLEFLAEDRAELRAGLLKLLQLMTENIGELVSDDRWLTGQVAAVREILAQPEMNPRAVNDAGRRLKEVIFKQGQLKHSLLEAQDALKQLLAGFVDHLADFADSTSGYHDKLERCADKISQAKDLTQLEDVLGEIVRETRVVQLAAQRSRDELGAMRQRVAEAEQRIGALQEELDKASQAMRHDQLTGALNRRGLDEMYESEVSRARRRRSPLSVAMLDIDNFKKLNDSLGHEAGDAALIHFVSVIRETLRPQDTLARFGGEEFIILLPDTPAADACQALIRVQRELTRRYFLANNEKRLITFSAGVTEVRPDDTQETAIKRGDEAMYAAKSAGKNRVVAG